MIFEEFEGKKVHPQIDLACKCGGTSFTAVLRGEDVKVRITQPNYDPLLIGQQCSVVMTCTACREWFSFTTVVPGITGWGRRLQEVVDQMRKEEPCPPSSTETPSGG